jgi:hypothetical protein
MSFMKKISIGTLILLLPVLAVLTGLTALPAVCLAQGELTATMSVNKEGVIQAGDSVTMTLTPSGGSPPYTYDYIMVIFEDGETHSFWSGFVPDSSYTWTVGFGDSAVLTGRVRDINTIVSFDAEILIRGSEHNPLCIKKEFIHPSDMIMIGDDYTDTFTFHVIADGGQPPYSYDFKLILYRDGWWSAPLSGNDYDHSSNSFSYKITSGTRGEIYSIVQDALGRKAFSDPFYLQIYKDNSAPMEFSATHSLEKLGTDRYLAALQATVKGGALPVNYDCWWFLFKDGELIEKRLAATNTDGAFSLEEDFDAAIAEVYATDADGWTCEDFLEIYFDTDDAVRPALSDLVRRDLLDYSLRNKLLYFNRSDLIRHLYDPSEPAPSYQVPGLNEGTPKLTNPELVTLRPVLVTHKPVQVRPVVTAAPTTAQPEVLNTEIVKPPLPILLQQPIRPKP